MLPCNKGNDLLKRQSERYVINHIMNPRESFSHTSENEIICEMNCRPVEMKK